MAVPRNLATDEVIDEQWVDDVVTELTALAPGSGRYPAKPSAGIVYGINHYHGALGANTVITVAALQLITVALPACPAGSLLDISWCTYINQSVVGTAGTFLSCTVNGVNQAPTVVVADMVQLMSYTGRVVAVAPPVGAAFNVTLQSTKGSGGTVQAQANNTTLDVVLYRP